MSLSEIIKQLAELQELIAGYAASRYTNYLAVGGYALTIADYLHTLPDEIRLMWPAPLSIPKVLFFALRYFTFVHISFHAVSLSPAISPEWCKTTTDRVGITSVLLVVGSEAILFLRVYAFTGRTTKMMIFLLALGIAGMSTAFVLTSKYLDSLKFIELPIPGIECLPVEADGRLIAGAFAALLVNAIIVMLIMVYTAYRQNLNLKHKLFKILYRDGIIYFILLTAFASANVVVNFAAPDIYTFLFIQPEVFIGVILSTRMLLHLRGWAVREKEGGSETAYQMGPMGSYRSANLSHSSGKYLNKGTNSFA